MSTNGAENRPRQDHGKRIQGTASNVAFGAFRPSQAREVGFGWFGGMSRRVWPQPPVGQMYRIFETQRFAPSTDHFIEARDAQLYYPHLFLTSFHIIALDL